MKKIEKNEYENIQYLTVKQVAADKNLGFTEAMLRYYLLHAHKNGLFMAVRRIGKKLLIRRDLFIEWIEMKTAKGVLS